MFDQPQILTMQECVAVSPDEASIQQRRLTTLACQIDDAHRDVRDRAHECGRWLCEAKKMVPHGAWVTWLKSATTVAPRTAQAYMKAFRANAHDPAHLDALFSSKTACWNTPQGIIEAVLDVMGYIDLDPCSNEGNPNIPAGRHFRAADDGLSHEWFGRVYMNPPYGKVIGEWTGKLLDAYRNQRVHEAIALVPARTDTHWFGDLGTFPTCFLRGRLKFGNANNSAPFPSAVIYLGDDPANFVDVFRPLGLLFQPVESQSQLERTLQ